jgi:hypothetical protein
MEWVGSGFLLSNAAANIKAAQEKAEMEGYGIIEWQLSEKEIDIINSLG